MSGSKPESNVDRVVSEIEIAAPQERVFEALVDQKQLAKWWGSEPSVELTRFEIDPRVGGRWSYECKPRPGRSEDTASSRNLRKNGATAYVAHGEILELDRPRLLVYTWVANWHEDPGALTTVRWELERRGGKTLVRVIHSGLANEPATREEYGGGWRGVLELLERFLLGK